MPSRATKPAYGPYEQDVGELARLRYAKVVVQRAGLLPGDRVLDVGTGTGFLGVTLARAGARTTVVGLDPDRARLRAARRNADGEGVGARVSLVQASAEALPFRAGSFSVYAAGLAFTGRRDPREARREAARVLVPMGKVAVVDVTRTAGGAPDPLSDANAERWKRLGFERVSVQKVAVLGDGRVLKALFARRGEPHDADDASTG